MAVAVAAASEALVATVVVAKATAEIFFKMSQLILMLPYLLRD